MDLFTTSKPIPNMTTREVHEAVKVLFGNYDYPLFNTFIFDWESDFFAISKSGYSVEVEVKVSRQDFKKDFTHKTDKHKIFTRRNEIAVCLPCTRFGISSESRYNPETKKYEKHSESSYINFVKPFEKLPNKFFYACPEGLIKPEEVPSYAGLIYTRSLYQGTIVKPAPFLHKNKRNFDNILLGKYYHRNSELAHLLYLFKRHNRLTPDQEKNLNAVISRMH